MDRSKQLKPKRVQKYVSRATAQTLNLHFYRSLDENFLLNKATTLYFVVEEFDQFKEFAESRRFDFEADEKRYLDSIRAELHFTEIHQAEALFALMMAVFQALPHWLYLTVYEMREIREAVRRFLDGDISSLTGGKLNSLREFVEVAIYTGVRSTVPEISSKWHENLDNIVWLLQRIARKFLEGTAEYNSYKHGLRIIPGGSSLSMYPDGQPEQAVTLIQSPDSLTFLELEDKGEGGLTVHMTTKHFSIKESYAHLIIMSRLIQAIKATRLGTLNKAEHVDLPTFFDLERKQIQSLGIVGRWSFTV